LAEVDGVVAPLGDALEVSALTAQEIEDGQRAGMDLPAAEVDVEPDGSRSIRSVRLDADARPLWSVPVLGPSAALPPEGADLSRCVTGAGERATAVCVVSDAVVRITSDVPSLDLPTTTTVVVVGTDDGRVLSSWSTAPAIAVASLPGLVLTGVADEATRVATVVAHDEETGAERWRYAMPLAEDSVVAGWGLGRPVYTAGDLVVVADQMAMTLLDADGRFIRDDLGGSDDVSTFGYVADGVLRVSRTTARGESTTTVVAPDGDPRADRVYAGDLLTPVDDGSAPGLVLAMTGGSLSLAAQMDDESTDQGTGPGLRAYDGTTGRELWFARMSSSSGSGAIVLRGRVYVTSTAAAVVALDARTGRTVWKTADAGMGLGMVTDGRWVYAVVNRPLSSEDAWLVGWDPRSGAERWSARLPDGLEAVTVSGHTLLGLDLTDGSNSRLS